MTIHKTQADIVSESMGIAPAETVERIHLPGINALHVKTKEEIAEALSNVLKSRNNIKALRYVVGEYIELTLGK